MNTNIIYLPTTTAEFNQWLTQCNWVRTSRLLRIAGVNVPRGAIIGNDSQGQFYISDFTIYYRKKGGFGLMVCRCYGDTWIEEFESSTLTNQLVWMKTDSKGFPYNRLQLGKMTRTNRDVEPVSNFDAEQQYKKLLLKIHTKPHGRQGSSWNGWAIEMLK